MTKNLKKLAAFALMAATMTSATMAQNEQQSSADNKKIEFSIHLGGNVPLGFWEDEEPDRIGYADIGLPLKSTSYDDGTYYGDADMGFNLGIKVKYNIPKLKGLGLMATADVFFNTSNDFELKEIDDDDFILHTTEHQCYINVPLMLGVNYNLALGNNFGIWAEAGIGANLRMITDQSYSFEAALSTLGEVEVISTWDYQNSIDMAFQVGIGMMIMDKVSLGVHYYNLGNSDVMGICDTKYITPIGTYTDGGDLLNYGKLNTSMFVFRLGYHF